MRARRRRLRGGAGPASASASRTPAVRPRTPASTMARSGPAAARSRYRSEIDCAAWHGNGGGMARLEGISGAASCGTGTCAADGESCDGSRLEDCEDGVLEVRDCAEHGLSCAVASDSETLCADADSGAACAAEDHCEGDTLVRCEDGAETRVDCSAQYVDATCVQQLGTADVLCGYGSECGDRPRLACRVVRGERAHLLHGRPHRHGRLHRHRLRRLLDRVARPRLPLSGGAAVTAPCAPGPRGRSSPASPALRGLRRQLAVAPDGRPMSDGAVRGASTANEGQAGAAVVADPPAGATRHPIRLEEADLGTRLEGIDRIPSERRNDARRRRPVALAKLEDQPARGCRPPRRRRRPARPAIHPPGPPDGTRMLWLRLPQ